MRVWKLLFSNFFTDPSSWKYVNFYFQTFFTDGGHESVKRRNRYFKTFFTDLGSWKWKKKNARIAAYILFSQRGLIKMWKKGIYVLRHFSETWRSWKYTNMGVSIFIVLFTNPWSWTYANTKILIFRFFTEGGIKMWKKGIYVLRHFSETWRSWKYTNMGVSIFIVLFTNPWSWTYANTKILIFRFFTEGGIKMGKKGIYVFRHFSQTHSRACVRPGAVRAYTYFWHFNCGYKISMLNLCNHGYFLFFNDIFFCSLIFINDQIDSNEFAEFSATLQPCNQYLKN